MAIVGSENITVIHNHTVIGEDEFGNAITSPVSETIKGALIGVDSSSTDETLFQIKNTSNITVYIPLTYTIYPTDTFIVRGVEYDMDVMQPDWVKPTGFKTKIKRIVNLKRI